MTYGISSEGDHEGRPIRINLSCLTVSPHSLRSGQALSRSEGSVCMGVEMLRRAQHDSVPLSPWGFSCPPEHSEGPVSVGVEMLRCPQHDSSVLLTRHRPYGI